MTNKERQVQLDKKKWLASEKRCLDLSGAMEYCENCQYCFSIGGLMWGCSASQDERVNKHLCATAYNKKSTTVTASTVNEGK